MNTNRQTRTLLLSVLKLVFSAAIFLLIIQTGAAQTFPGNILNTAGNSAIPSTGTGGCTVAPQTTGGTFFQNIVAGIPANSALLQVRTTFNHTFTSDIDMYLVAPNGQIIELSTDNGGGGDNFINTVFDDAAAINITAGAPPYTGTFRPEGTLTTSTCGTTVTPTVTTLGAFALGQNGTWQLQIKDDVGADVGLMMSWSLVFGIPVPPCLLVQPANITVGNNPGTCVASPSVTLPATNPAGCANGTTVGLRYKVGNGMFVNVPLPATSVIIPNLPGGVSTIMWQTYNIATGAVFSTVTQTITVVDSEPPVLICPADINITLDPGACSTFVGYTIDATDNCPFTGPAGSLTTTPGTDNNQNSPGGVVFFDLRNDYGGPMTITAMSTKLVGPSMINIYTKSGTGMGFEQNAGAWTLAATGNATGGPFTPALTPFVVNFQIQPGVTGIALHAVTTNSRYTNGIPAVVAPYGTATNGMFTDGSLTILAGATSNTFFASAPFNPRIWNGSVTYETVSGGNILQTSGLPSGSEFPIGTTTNCFTVDDAQGNIGTCCFDVTILEYPFPSTTLACNDNVQVSVNENCEAFVTTDMILEGGPYGCYDDYIVEIEGYGTGFGGVTIDVNAVGETLFVTVTDPETGNSCWGTISVEDKIPPTIECRDVVIMCGQQLPDLPAPGISGYQTILYTGLNDLLEFNTWEYDFDFTYLPSTPVLDANVRIKIDDHTWLPDVKIEVESPGGTVQPIFDITGCILQDWPIDVVFDDEGGVITLCMDLNAGGAPLQPLLPPGVSQPALFNLDGLDASGVWTVRIADIFAADDGHIREVGLSLLVDLPQVDPADNCGDVEITFTDTESGDPCEGLIVTRHWVVTDESGNTATCDQQITVTPLVLDSVDCPLTVEAHCGQSSDPHDIAIYLGPEYAWPSVNGNPITDEENVCNIFVGYWDQVLNDCGNGEKIIRHWTVLDWCTQSVIECIQILKFSDDEAPELTCPDDFEVGTDFWYCYANVSVPKPDVFDACSSAYTLNLTSTAGFIVNFGNNFVINQLPLGTHTVCWLVEDECGNSSSCCFEITVVDDVVPVANCDEHTVVSLTNDGPFGITLVPATVFDDGSYDNCGPVTFRARRMDSCIEFDWTTEGACIDHIPGGIPPVNSRDRGTVHRPCVPFACCDVGAGPIMVELEVTDASDNVNYCMVEAIVQDKISPFIECPPDIIVSCDFWFNLEEGTFEDSEDDGGNGNGNLDEDPLSVIFGNMFDAFAYNDDESVRQDIIINDPGNEDFSQPHFWGIDGWADDNCEVNLSVRVRIIDDCSGDDLPGNAPPGAVKLIERRFSASDGNDGVAPGTCTQRIWVVDFDPFYISDFTCNNADPNDGVIWPCDVLLTTCPEDLGDTGEPIVFDDACSLIGIAYEDTRFDFVDGACFKILREWTIIDWCQYGPDGEGGYFGIWSYIQVIKVHDQEGPEFEEPCDDVVLCVADPGVSLPDNNQAFLGEDDPDASSCSAHLNLCRIVHETCSDFVTFDVKIYPNNGDDFWLVKPSTTIAVDSNNNAELCFDTRNAPQLFIREDGIPYNSKWCGDYHRILWTVEDGCGNFSTCEYLFRLEDCKQPSPVCINGLSTVVMPVGGQVTIWAKDFDASSFDDCTPAEDLLFSFSGDTYEPSFTYTCDNVPAFGVEFSVQIWVADEGTDDNCNDQISWAERNKDYCTTTLVITDNNGVCGDTTGSILGEILTEDVQSVELVSVSLNAPGHFFPTYVTTTNGAYNFNHVIIPANFSIEAERNDAHRNGVSTLDLVKIQKHLLGIELMNSPYDLIAADANNSQNVSAIDLVELRKLILGIYTELPLNQSWRFVDKSYQFADASNPWPFSESITMNGLLSGVVTDKDFVAVKVGDVNNTVQANALQILPRGGHNVVNFVADERTVNVGEMVEVEIRSSDFKNIEGYQFTMEMNGLEFRGVESGAVTMTDENLGVFGSTLTASWHKVGGVNTTSSDVLFTLNFQAIAAGQISNMISLNSKVTEAEAYNTSSDIKDLKLTFRGAEHEAAFALYQNEPNPFKGNTVIGYDLPEAGNVTLTVFDVAGKVLLVKEQESVKGYNTIALSSKDMPSIGVLYYRLDANEYTATKKMIIIE